jgi:hypothetical protein
MPAGVPNEKADETENIFLIQRSSRKNITEQII